MIDASSGKIVKTWRGSLARAGEAAPAAKAAAGKTVLIQMIDAGNVTNFGAQNYRDIWTLTNPLDFFPWGVDTFGTISANAATAQPWVVDVSQHFCTVRRYCGRDSALPGPVGHGDYNRLFFAVNWKPFGNEAGRYFNDRMHITASSATKPQVVAHEFGHQIDRYFRDDYLDAFEGQEVSEALAEMFAYDYEREKSLPGATGTRMHHLLFEPGFSGFPKDMDHYDCATTEEHDNGYILGHAYWRMVDGIRLRLGAGHGHVEAGDMLQGVPWRLPGARTFGSVRSAFVSIARISYPGPGFGGTGGQVEAAVNEAFGAVGVSSTTSRAGRCASQPSPPPPPLPPVCKAKPSVCESLRR